MTPHHEVCAQRAAVRCAPPPRPSPAELAAARNRTIPDVLPAPGEPLRVLFCGINPSLYSAATGWHFARPGNRFWPALHLSGFTPRRLAPREQDLLPGYGLGITNLVARATAQAAELDAAELQAGGERLLALIQRSRPRILAIAGVTAYRTAFGHPRALIGPQPGPIGGSRVWVLPNPSGLNAHWTLDPIAAEFAALRAAATAEDRDHLSERAQCVPRLTLFAADGPRLTAANGPYRCWARWETKRAPRVSQPAR
jgi:double-stranded uracil-DNA glycosylase